MTDISERLIEQFSHVSAAGAELELRMRLLCGIVPEISETSTSHRLEKVEEAILSHFAVELSANDQQALVRARQLRNKVLHADFHAARSKLTEIDGTVPVNVTRMTKLDVDRVVEHVSEIAQNPGAHGTEVGKTSSTAEGTVFGWLLEFGLSGEFMRATDAFRRASAVVERLRAHTED